jgi:probable addiction module antidote protein
MAKEKITRWNVLDYLTDENAIAAYLKAAVSENDPNTLILAIGDIAKAKGINDIAQKMGVNRESLYKSFSGKVKPKFETIYNAIDKLGFQMSFQSKY